MAVRIEVTQQHINASDEDCSWCPIERAMLPHLKPGVSWMVTGSGYLYIGHDISDREKISLPIEAVQFVARYDRNEGAGPFSFELELPAEYVL